MTTSIPSTYLTPPVGRPTRATLSQSLDFKIPLRFAEYVGNLYDFCGGDPELCLDVFDATLGLFPSGPEARYPGTPPELFPVGKTHCDGDHYGFVLHAPELDLDDLPYGNYCPMDGDGVILRGLTADQGIASIMARHLSYDFESATKKKLITDFSTSCNIQPLSEHNPTISIPNGWSYFPSADGIGTLAPAQLFSPQPLVWIDNYGGATSFVQAADQAMNDGYYATALHFLREGLWFNWCHFPFDLAQRMVDVYNLMDREKLAIELKHTIRRWTEMYLLPKHDSGK